MCVFGIGCESGGACFNCDKRGRAKSALAANHFDDKFAAHFYCPFYSVIWNERCWLLLLLIIIYAIFRIFLIPIWICAFRGIITFIPQFLHNLTEEKEKLLNFTFSCYFYYFFAHFYCCFRTVHFSCTQFFQDPYRIRGNFFCLLEEGASAELETQRNTDKLKLNAKS